MNAIKEAAQRLKRIKAGENPEEVYRQQCRQWVAQNISQEAVDANPGWSFFGQKLFSELFSGDRKTLAEAYLAEHDETPVTEEWLLATGFDDPSGHKMYRRYFRDRLDSSNDTFVQVMMPTPDVEIWQGDDIVALIHLTTIGQLTRLVNVLEGR